MDILFAPETAEAAEHAASTFSDLAFLVPLLSFAAFALIVSLGKRTPGKGAPIGIIATFVALVISAAAFFESLGAHEAVEHSLRWISVGSIDLELGIAVDTLSAMMFVVVCFVSLLVQVYSTGYMQGDVRYTWYFAALNLFTGSMLTLVAANNTLQLLVGWELVGVCSYLLIGHWFEEKENSSAAIKAFLTTKVGDLGFIVGVFVLLVAAKTANIAKLQEIVAAGGIAPAVVTAGAVLLFMGAMGKSAMFPLHVWLPDAMAGPTPVSALIHAATMVAAGVYMVARIYGVFHASDVAMAEIAIIASITMLGAALLATVQRDIKRVMAYSTVSQLAYMMAGLAVGGYTAGVFHLFTHAFFKALLFLGCGSVIHAVHSNDMFDMGGLKKYMPITFWTFLIGSLALSGVPPFAGFFSKDEILAEALHGGHYVVLACGLLTAFITAFYVGRALTLTFAGKYRRMPIAGAASGDDSHGHHGLPHESPPSMTWPLMILAGLSVVVGFLGFPGRSVFATWVHHEAAKHGEFVPWLALVSVALAGTGLLTGYRLYSHATFGFSVKDPLERFGFFYRAAVNRFYIDDLYMKALVKPIQYGLSKLIYERVDQKGIDRIVNAAGAGTVLAGRATRAVDEEGVDGVVNGLAALTDKFGTGLRRLQTGNVQRYAIGLFMGVIVLAAVFYR